MHHGGTFLFQTTCFARDWYADDGMRPRSNCSTCWSSPPAKAMQYEDFKTPGPIGKFSTLADADPENDIAEFRMSTRLRSSTNEWNSQIFHVSSLHICATAANSTSRPFFDQAETAAPGPPAVRLRKASSVSAQLLRSK